MSNQQKVCVVTGGSKGIGAAVCDKFNQAGYQVFNLDLSPHTADTKTQWIECDVAQQSSVQQAFEQISQIVGHIDCLVSNAGIHLSANIEETTEAQFDNLFAINVKGAMFATQACLPKLKQSRGSIVYVASDQAIVGKRNSFAYNLSKASLASMAKTTALDYASYGVTANAVCPGTIETPLYHNAIDKYVASSGADAEQVHAEEAALQPLGRLGQADEVAELILFLASDKARFITGSLHAIDGGYTAQ